jgi:hypothetical protein
LLVTVTSLPEAARPAITSEPCGSTRTTSNDGAGAEGSVAGFESIGVSREGGTAACCVAVGAAVVAGAVVAAALFETEALGVVAVAPAEPVPDVALPLGGADEDAVPAGAASAWAAFVPAVGSVVEPAVLVGAAVVCDVPAA